MGAADGMGPPFGSANEVDGSSGGAASLEEVGEGRGEAEKLNGVFVARRGSDPCCVMAKGMGSTFKEAASTQWMGGSD